MLKLKCRPLLKVFPSPTFRVVGKIESNDIVCLCVCVRERERERERERKTKKDEQNENDYK